MWKIIYNYELVCKLYFGKVFYESSDKIIIFEKEEIKIFLGKVRKIEKDYL